MHLYLINEGFLNEQSKELLNDAKLKELEQQMLNE